MQEKKKITRKTMVASGRFGSSQSTMKEKSSLAVLRNIHNGECIDDLELNEPDPSSLLR